MTTLSFPYTESQRRAFRTGRLVNAWDKKYPSIFDRHDATLARSQPSYHFFEWLGAVLLFESTGYLSLLEKWDCPSHARKQKIFRKVVGRDLAERILANSAGMPDLFVYSRDRKDWFFCEVKGPRDRLRSIQKRKINAFEKKTRKEVLFINFIKVP